MSAPIRPLKQERMFYLISMQGSLFLPFNIVTETDIVNFDHFYPIHVGQNIKCYLCGVEVSSRVQEISSDYDYLDGVKKDLLQQLFASKVSTTSSTTISIRRPTVKQLSEFQKKSRGSSSSAMMCRQLSNHRSIGTRTLQDNVRIWNKELDNRRQKLSEAALESRRNEALSRQLRLIAMKERETKLLNNLIDIQNHLNKEASCLPPQLSSSENMLSNVDVEMTGPTELLPEAHITPVENVVEKNRKPIAQNYNDNTNTHLTENINTYSAAAVLIKLRESTGYIIKQPIPNQAIESANESPPLLCQQQPQQQFLQEQQPQYLQEQLLKQDQQHQQFKLEQQHQQEKQENRQQQQQYYFPHQQQHTHNFQLNANDNHTINNINGNSNIYNNAQTTPLTSKLTVSQQPNPNTNQSNDTHYSHIISNVRHNQLHFVPICSVEVNTPTSVITTAPTITSIPTIATASAIPTTPAITITPTITSTPNIRSAPLVTSTPTTRPFTILPENQIPIKNELNILANNSNNNNLSSIVNSEPKKTKRTNKKKETISPAELKETIQIGPGGTRVPAYILRQIPIIPYSRGTRKLLQACFSREILGTHTLSGNKSPAFADRKVKKALDPNIVADIIYCIKTQYAHDTDRYARGAITSACADENKMLKARLSKESHNSLQLSSNENSNSSLMNTLEDISQSGENKSLIVRVCDTENKEN